jgi:hypothetical protein
LKYLVISLISLAVPAFPLDPAMLNIVSPDATALVGIDVVRVRASPFGQLLIDQVTQRAGNLDKIASATGFDPRRDLQEVLVAASGTGATSQGLIVARGTFDQQRLINMAATAGFTSSTYKGTTLFTMDNNATGDVAAFLLGYFVGGTREEVRAAIDRTSSRANSGLLGGRALLASTKYDAWLVTSAPADLPQGLTGGSQIPLHGLNSVLGGAQFGNQVDIGVEAEARSVQDATSIADVLRFAAALGQSNKSAAQLGNFLNSLTVTTSGTVVKAALKVSQADLERLLNQGTGRARHVASR